MWRLYASENRVNSDSNNGPLVSIGSDDDPSDAEPLSQPGLIYSHLDP